MDDDDEVQSHQSAGSGSPESPVPNRRITVTVAATAPPSHNTLTLALPIQQPRSGGGGGGGGVSGGGGGGREDCWSEGATAVLIDAWGERYVELSRGNLKQKHWKEVADIVSSREDYSKPAKTDIQCKNRIDTVKKKYKLEKTKIASGGGPSKWNFYNRLDHLIGPTAAKTAAAAGPSSAPASLKTVPMGIPVGVRSVPPPNFQKHGQNPRVKPQPQLQLQSQSRRRPPPITQTLSESSESEPEPPSPDSTDSFVPPTYERKRPRVQVQRMEVNLSGVSRQGEVGKDKNWGSSVKELTRAILKFGETYEHAESSKLQQLVEMEKQRLKFAKELELQRMQFFMKTQLELSQLKQHRRVGNNSNHHHNHHGNNNNNVNNHHSDSNN